MMKRTGALGAAVGVLSVLLSTGARAEWRYSEAVDTMTDKVRATITTRNDTGHELSVYVGPDGTAWTNFSLPDHGSEVLGDPWPTLRVDKNEAESLATEKQMDDALGELKQALGELRGTSELHYPMEMQPKWINWNASDYLIAELKAGNTIRFRYSLFTGGTRETTFDLAGFTTAFNQLRPKLKAKAKE